MVADSGLLFNKFWVCRSFIDGDLGSLSSFVTGPRLTLTSLFSCKQWRKWLEGPDKMMRLISCGKS